MRLGDGLWRSAGHRDDDSPTRWGTIPGRSRSNSFLCESLLFTLPIFPQDTLNLFFKSSTQASALPFVELFHAGPLAERISDILRAEVVITSGNFTCKYLEFLHYFFNFTGSQARARELFNVMSQVKPKPFASSSERVPSMLALAIVAVQSSKICLKPAYVRSSMIDF